MLYHVCVSVKRDASTLGYDNGGGSVYITSSPSYGIGMVAVTTENPLHKDICFGQY